MSAGGAPVILLYHQVGTAHDDPFNQFVGAENFAGHMAVLARRRPVRLVDLANDVRSRTLSAGSVAVTFDDGYLSNLRVAKPVLEREGVPATVFVTTGATGGARDFWWNELHSALVRVPASAPALRLAAGGNRREWTLREGDRPGLLFEIWAWIRAQGPGHVGPLMASVAAWAGVEAAGPPPEDHRCMSVEELKMLVEGEIMDIGAHTRTHPMLSACSPAELRNEISGSRADLEEWLGRPVTTFAYPFGLRVVEYRAAAVRAVHAAGFEAAVAVEPRPVSVRSPIFELPRYAVPDLAPDDFERWLAERMDGPAPPRRAIDRRVVRALRERRPVRDRL